jgi:peptide/nickel transport system substrate-binding protein
MESFLTNWRCSQMPGPDNGWTGSNLTRWCSEEYDTLFAEYSQTGGIEARAAMVIQLNDLIVQNYSQIPLVYRSTVSSAHANSLGGINVNGWDSEMWNIEEWFRIE